MTSHILSLNHPKMPFGKIRSAMFHVAELHFELIFCLLISSKSDLGKVEKEMFQVANCSFLLIFFLLNCPKFVLDEVEKAMFQVVDRHCEESFSILSQNATWVPKRKQCFKWSPSAENFYSDS